VPQNAVIAVSKAQLDANNPISTHGERNIGGHYNPHTSHPLPFSRATCKRMALIAKATGLISAGALVHAQ
jgi:hypothetical protein